MLPSVCASVRSMGMAPRPMAPAAPVTLSVYSIRVIQRCRSHARRMAAQGALYPTIGYVGSLCIPPHSKTRAKSKPMGQYALPPIGVQRPHCISCSVASKALRAFESQKRALRLDHGRFWTQAGQSGPLLTHWEAVAAGGGPGKRPVVQVESSPLHEIRVPHSIPAHSANSDCPPNTAIAPYQNHA